MIYNLEAIKDFTDVHDKKVKYTVGQEIRVGEERAFELLSNPNGLVKILSTTIENVEEFVGSLPDFVKEKIIEDYLNSENNNINPENNNNITPTDPFISIGDSDDLNSKSFKELQEIAQSKGIDITGLTKKDKLIAEILKK